MGNGEPLGGGADPYRELIGEILVVDTDSAFVYLGRLEAADALFLQLSEVDAHEIREAGLSKERYAHEARGIGVRPNRKYTWVRLARVIAVTRLTDVVSF